MEYNGTAPTNDQFVDFSFCKSEDMNEFVSVRVDSLWGLPINDKGDKTISMLREHFRLHGLDDFTLFSLDNDISTTKGPSPVFFVTLQLWSMEIPLSLPLQTKYCNISDNDKGGWYEWVRFPTKYCELSRDAYIVVTLWELNGLWSVVSHGTCRIEMFSAESEMVQGEHRLPLSPKGTSAKQQTENESNFDKKDIEYDRLFELVRKFEDGDIHRVDWIDSLAMDRINEIENRDRQTSDTLYIHITFPKFDFAVVFGEAPLDDPLLILFHPKYPRFCPVFDPESARDNPSESKHRRLLRGYRSDPLDRELKPDSKIRDQLNAIIRYPPGQELLDAEKNLVWRFRFYLSNNKKALTKFVRCVDWSDPIEAKQATGLLAEWAEIDIDDALELLGVRFTNYSVRGYAVSKLRKANDDVLILYLIQLVQAVKFEYFSNNNSENNPITSATAAAVSDTSVTGLNGESLAEGSRQILNRESNLAKFLIERALHNNTLGNFLYWYLMVECDDRKSGKIYGKLVFQYITALSELSDGQRTQKMFERQSRLVSDLARVSNKIQALKEPRQRKIEWLRNYLADSRHGLASFPPLPLPLDPTVEVVGINAEKASVFKSTMMPLFLHFIKEDGSEYPVIFKSGDDMRQDQLVIQIISLMDNLLRSENLDLRLMPYRVLATGADQGFSQFIKSQSLAAILAAHNNSILAYLRTTNPDPEGPFGVSSDVMETYVKSCAGYCVITYLLGVGDRHLDNLLLTTDGHLFHVDFGYILGRDPKPFPPPMKLCKEMVEAMGGMESTMYQRFKSHCFVAFSILRKSANLILNLFSLMVHSNIPDIAVAPDQAVEMVQEKFRLDLSEEEAMRFFQTLINDSVKALFPQVIETIHKWAQYWRN